MATTYDKASLVMIPSGYKDTKLYSVKPTDGDGDFTFSRGSNLAATRVNASGLIEKGRENILLQSNTFDTTWTAARVSLNGGQVGYDGTNDGWSVTPDTNSNTHAILQSGVAVSNGVYTYSVYAKANGYNYIALRDSSATDGYAKFDLINGLTETSGSTAIDSNITSVGNGWWRCSLSVNKTSGASNNFVIYINEVYQYNYVYAGNGTDGILIQDAQVESGLVATDYIETTTTSVQAGILEDMPRLDYSGGASCPSLLLEPSRTNNIAFSEYIAAGVTWITTGGMLTTQNDAVSPEGVQNAVKMTRPSNTGAAWLTNFISGDVGQNQVLSLFAKEGTGSILNFTYFDSVAGDMFFNFDLSTGQTASLPTSSPYYVDAGIEDYGNGWYRCYAVIETASTTSRQFQIAIGTNRYGVADEYIHIYGASWENNASYPTSYIPSYVSAVTRSNDSCSKTGISDLIGQSEGVVFLDFVYKPLFDDANSQTTHRFSVSDGTYTNRITLYPNNSDELGVLATGVNFTGSAYTLTEGQRYKVALAYGTTSVVYINGVEAFGYGSGTPTGGYDRMQFADATNTLTRVFGSPVNQALLFKTRLTNAELAALTTI